ncbi:MAG: hypothetical protein JWL60_1127 [Gemmatimonadetes bacterium]|nr:hypothetical protein [Gemmatimonadota bacterium]
MIALLGDVHDMLAPMRDTLARLPREVRAIVQVGDMWAWPEAEDVPPLADGTPREVPRRPWDASLHWRRPPRDLLWIDGNHHPYWLTRGPTVPTRLAPGLTYLPRGTVLTLDGQHGALRVGFLGGADSVIDAGWRRLGDDWWPEEERVAVADVERLLANAQAAGGLDLLVTHTPPATITGEMIADGRPPHPSSVLVEEAWRALGGGNEDATLALVSGHMHQSWRSEPLRVEVLPFFGLTVR